MDHLPRLNDPAHDFEVPCLCTEEYPYDGLEFKTFPVRQGCNKAELLHTELEERERRDAAAMLQAWLFFGVLTEVLVRPINPDDFRRVNEHGQLVITTALLPLYLNSWIETFARLPDDVQERNMDRASKCLEELSYYVTRHFHAGRLSPMSDIVVISLRLLGEALTVVGQADVWKCAVVEFMGIPRGFRRPMPVMFGFGGSALMDMPLFREWTAHWCPNERRRLVNLPVAPLLLLSQLKQPSDNRDHSSCTTTACTAYNIDEDNYETAHHQACQGCELHGLSESALIDMIDAGSLPLVSIDLSSGKPRLEYVEYKPGLGFTAISHVWSDGLGNARGPALPECQLAQIAKYLEAPKDFDVKWFLGNGQQSDQVSCRRPRSYQSRADEFVTLLGGYDGNAVRSAYNRNQEVMKPKTITGMVVRNQPDYADLWRSQWGKRAGTTPPEPLSTEEFSHKLEQARSTQNRFFWMDTLCIPRAQPARLKAISDMGDVYRVANRVLVLDARLQSLSNKSSAMEMLLTLATSGWMRRMWTFHEGTVAQKLGFCLSETVLDNSDLKFYAKLFSSVDFVSRFLLNFASSHQFFDLGNSYTRLMAIVTSNSIAGRSLSRPADETIVLAMLLNMPRDLVQTLQSIQPLEQRMRKFWELQGEVPRGLLIWSGARLTEFPFRWAPSSLMDFMLRYREPSPPAAAWSTPRGLHVKNLPGWVFRVRSSLEHYFYLGDEISKCWFTVYKDEEALKTSMWAEQGKMYAIVVLNPVPEMRNTQGVLAEVLEMAHGGRTFYTTFVCNVRVGRLVDEDEMVLLWRMKSGLEHFRGLAGGHADILHRLGVISESRFPELDWFIG